ncbi:MAG: PqqD family peptide modification chaperone [Pyrinomonadaceae bacterium]
MHIDQFRKPLARKGSLIVKEVSGEVLIYDLDRDKAHCLNETAALVWKYCDGKKDAAAIARRLEKDLNTTVDEKIVWYALSQLSKDHLLEEQVTPPALIAGLNRRDMIRALGIAAVVAVPVVTSIVAPTAVQAGVSCFPQGSGCETPSQCCSGRCVEGVCQ